MAEGVAGDSFGDSAFLDGAADFFLQYGFVQMVTSAVAGFGVEVQGCGWEDPLPGPVPC